MKTAPYKIFGITKDVPVVTYTDEKKDDPPRDVWDAELWIERDEDLYGLDFYARKKMTVRIIDRGVWLKSKEIKE